MVRRSGTLLLEPACALALGLACFHAVLFDGGRLAYRDAGHFYDPLYRVVQGEWAAGRWPLWNPWQNAGTPILGWPMAAVFYPGKLIYAALPYPAAAAAYVLVHLAIALAGAYALARSMGTSSTGSTLSALGYAFGAPVLTLDSNVIYLVGAAWMPWGLAALQLAVRGRMRRGLAGLAAALAMQVLGGDPEAAYLTGLAGALFAILLSDEGEAGDARPEGSRRRVLGMAGALAGWSLAVVLLNLASVRGCLPAWESTGRLFARAIVLIVAMLVLGRTAPRRARLRRLGTLGVVGGSIVLAMLLSGVQLVPAWEYARQTTRQDGPLATGLQDFSVEPYRLAELAWPHVYGLEVPENRSWLQALPPVGERMAWSPSLYMGAFLLLLAASIASLRGGPASRRWLTVLAIFGLAGAMGKFAGPLWWARIIPGSDEFLGPLDPTAGIARADGFLPDGAGSVYGLLATFLPGFAMFRYPAKLMVVAALAIACLAGSGWDRLRGEASVRGRLRRFGTVGVALGAALAVLVSFGRPGIEAWIGRSVPIGSTYGPVDARGAVDAISKGLIQGGIVLGLGVAVSMLAARWPRSAGACALILVTADLALAGHRLVGTVPRSALDGTPEIARLIARAEDRERALGPFRIHRVEQWHPSEFTDQRSSSRLSELVAWEHDTLDRLHAEPQGLAYTVVRGVVDVADYLEFFEARATRARDERGAERTVYSFPRGGYDLWGARYLIMPVGLNGWMGPERGYIRIAPGDDVVDDPEASQRWVEHQGWQLLRNPRAFPRCWVVHSAIVIPTTTLGSPERAELVATLVDSASGGPTAPRRGTVDLHRTAFVEIERLEAREELSALRIPPAEADGTVTMTRYEPQRVEIRADLRRPGLVVLADVLDPGWVLTIDGKPAPIWRTNRMMRGALVPAGDHALVYEYRPSEMPRAAAMTAAGAAVLALLILVPGRTASRIDVHSGKRDEPGRSPD
ncbi:MAG: hypothetical protein ACYC61_00065 [Isosphaeraceae bacterium]